jgi:type II secretory pathway component PulC
MDHNHLRKFFPLHPPQDQEILDAQQKLRESANDLAVTINKFMPESPTKMELLMRLLHLMRDVDLAIQLDGVSRVTPMVVMQ